MNHIVQTIKQRFYKHNAILHLRQKSLSPWFGLQYCRKSMVIHSWLAMLRKTKLLCDRNQKQETNALWFSSKIRIRIWSWAIWISRKSYLCYTFFHDVFFDPLHYLLWSLEAHSNYLSSSLISVMHPQIKRIDWLELSIFMCPNYMLNRNRPECCHFGSDTICSIPFIPQCHCVWKKGKIFVPWLLQNQSMTLTITPIE